MTTTTLISKPTLRAQLAGHSRYWLAAVVVERVGMRLFTDTLHLLPRFFGYFDLVLLALLAGYVWVTARDRPARGRTGFELPGLLLLAWAGVSAVFNLQRVNFAAGPLFLFGLIEPILFMVLAYRLAPDRASRAFLERTIYALGWLQIAVVVVIDLPQFFASGYDPDLVSGTFGQNAYQLVHFMIAWNALFLFRAARRLHSVLGSLGILAVQAVVAAVVLLAQFRALLPFMFLTWILTLVLVFRFTRRSLWMTALSLCIAAGIFIAIDRAFPRLRWSQVSEVVQQPQAVKQSGKMQAVLNFGRLIQEQPQVLLIGTGPGTYASRGFRTFSIVGQADIANQLYRSLLHRDYYTTDVAERFTLPVTGLTAFGSGTAAAPWFSYLAIPAELGLPGLALVLIIYGLALWKTFHIFRAGRDRPNSAAGLALFTFIGLALVLQMGFLENWLEVSRVTVPLWLAVGVLLSSREDTGNDARQAA